MALFEIRNGSFPQNKSGNPDNCDTLSKGQKPCCQSLSALGAYTRHIFTRWGKTIDYKLSIYHIKKYYLGENLHLLFYCTFNPITVEGGEGRIRPPVLFSYGAQNMLIWLLKALVTFPIYILRTLCHFYKKKLDNSTLSTVQVSK